MEFDDLLTDIDLECPACNRKFQQRRAARGSDGTAECPDCGAAVRATGADPGEKPES